MSHFTLIVVGSNVDEQMAPFAEQEFEEKYAVFNDTEEECRVEYESKEVDLVILADGSIHNKYESIFKKNVPMSFSNDYVYPEDATIRKGKFSELYDTFEDFMAYWHGSSKRDEKENRYGYWHNPNAKYDWYTLGGRWAGFFKLKDNASGVAGKGSLVGGNKAPLGWADSVKVKDIDFEGMFAQSKESANKTYDELEAVLKGRQLPSWKACLAKYGDDVDAARKEYGSLDVVKDLNSSNFFVMGDFVDYFGNSREEYLEKCKLQTMMPYAVLMDGVWYQQGEMGWFGMSNDEMTQEEWNKQFWEVINSLNPETELNLLDCHI